MKKSLYVITPLTMIAMPAVVVACGKTELIWDNLLPADFLQPENYHPNNYYQSPLNDAAMSPILKNYLEPYVLLHKDDLQWADLKIKINFANQQKRQQLNDQMRQRLGLVKRTEILNLPTDFNDFFVIENDSTNLWKVQLAPVQPLINPFTNQPVIFLIIAYNNNFLTLYESPLAQIDPVFQQSQFPLVKTALNDLLRFDLPKDYPSPITYSDTFRTDLTWFQFYSQAVLKNLQIISEQTPTNPFGFPNGVLAPILSDRNAFLQQFLMQDNGTIGFSAIRTEQILNQDQFGLWTNFYLFGGQMLDALNDYYKRWIEHIDWIRTNSPEKFDSNQVFMQFFNEVIRLRFAALTRLWSQWQQQSVLKTFNDPATQPAITGFQVDLSITTSSDFNSKPLSLKWWQIQYPSEQPMAINLELGRLLMIVGAFLKVTDPQVQANDQGILKTTNTLAWPVQNGLFLRPWANEYEKHYQLLMQNRFQVINPPDLQLGQIFGQIFAGRALMTPALQG